MADETKPCPYGCDGSGYVVIDDLHTRECMCSYVKRLYAHLGPEIGGAPRLTGSSPLLWPQDGVDLTTKNVVIKGYWTDILPHMRWVLGCKGTMFRFKVLTDEKLRTVYVGAEAYTSRARSKRDDVETFNTLADIVGAEWDLLIIRLGFLGYKNVAMPGVLQEALMLREVALKPTWLIESPSTPYAPGHFAFSDEAFDYIQRRFEVVEISEFDPTRQEATAPQGYQQTTAQTAPAVKRMKARPAAPPGMEVEEEMPVVLEDEPAPEADGDMALDMPGAGNPKSKFKKGRKGGRSWGD